MSDAKESTGETPEPDREWLHPLPVMAARQAIQAGYLPDSASLEVVEAVAREQGLELARAGLPLEHYPTEELSQNLALARAIEVLGRERFDALVEQGYADGTAPGRPPE